VTRRATAQTSRNLLKGAAAAHSLGCGHALLKRPDLELVGGHKGLEVEFSILEGGVGGLGGNVACDVNLGALLGKVVAAGIGRWGVGLSLLGALPR
jgi:hypothetical protein